MLHNRQTVVLFGDKNDPSVKESINRIAIAGRKVQLQAAPSHDTGQGDCGKQCSCKGYCKVAYDGDRGATMGTGY
jgi:hypothetical protein